MKCRYRDAGDKTSIDTFEFGGCVVRAREGCKNPYCYQMARQIAQQGGYEHDACDTFQRTGKKAAEQERDALLRSAETGLKRQPFGAPFALFMEWAYSNTSASVHGEGQTHMHNTQMELMGIVQGLEQERDGLARRVEELEGAIGPAIGRLLIAQLMLTDTDWKRIAAEHPEVIEQAIEGPLKHVNDPLEMLKRVTEDAKKGEGT